MRLICWAVIATCLTLSQIASATTVATLISDFRSDIGQEDSTNSNYTNAQVRRLLTRGQTMVSTIIGGLPIQSKIALVNQKTAYSLSTALWGYEAALFKKSVDYIQLQLVDMADLGTEKFKSLPTGDGTKPTEGETDKQTQIEQYAIFDDTIFIYPTLSKFSSDTLHVMGYGATASLDSNSQTTELKVWTDEFVIEAAVFLANKRDLSLGDETSWWTSFYNRVLAAQSLYAKKQPALRVPPVQGQ